MKMKTNNTDRLTDSEGELAARVLKHAAQDLRRFHTATSQVERDLYYDAYRWVMADDYSWPYSFQNVCRLLNHGPDELRQEVVGDLAFGRFGQWARRSGRAVRRLSHFLRTRQALRLPRHTRQAC